MAVDFLDRMARESERRAGALDATDLRARLRDLPPPRRLTLDHSGFDLIAEIKLRSPAAGRLGDATKQPLEERAASYERAGAAAVSVLTEPTAFDGQLEHLGRVARHVNVPVMRKDFLVDPRQLVEARVSGADGVLLIAALLDSPGRLRAMVDRAGELGLFVLVEAFGRGDLERIARLLEEDPGTSELLVGLNARDLESLQVRPERLVAEVDRLPTGRPRVAESSVDGPEDAARLARAGYDVALVGSALMREADPEDLTRAMLQAGRDAARGRCRSV